MEIDFERLWVGTFASWLPCPWASLHRWTTKSPKTTWKELIQNPLWPEALLDVTVPCWGWICSDNVCSTKACMFPSGPKRKHSIYLYDESSHRPKCHWAKRYSGIKQRNSPVAWIYSPAVTFRTFHTHSPPAVPPNLAEQRVLDFKPF